jgi:hypothetical protein
MLLPSLRPFLCIHESWIPLASRRPSLYRLYLPHRLTLDISSPKHRYHLGPRIALFDAAWAGMQTKIEMELRATVTMELHRKFLQMTRLRRRDGPIRA